MEVEEKAHICTNQMGAIMDVNAAAAHREIVPSIARERSTDLPITEALRKARASLFGVTDNIFKHFKWPAGRALNG